MENVLADRIHISLQGTALQAESVVKAFSVRRIYGAVDGVVGDRRRDFARPDSVESRRPCESREFCFFEQQCGRLAERFYVGRAPPVSQPQSRERKLTQRIACENREALGIGIVIFLQGGIDGHLLAKQQSLLARGIVVEPVEEDSEPGRKRTVEQDKAR